MINSNQASQSNDKDKVKEITSWFKKELSGNTTQDIWGNKEELGANVHCHDRKQQAEFFNRTIEHSTDHMGWCPQQRCKRICVEWEQN